MKKLNVFTLSSFLATSFLFGFSQENFPYFLEGKWKIEGSESYEEWTKHGDNLLKGISYTLKNGEFMLSEYLDIKVINKEVYYIPTVIGQNYNQEIRFKLRKVDNRYNFENPLHDFPKKITYTVIRADSLMVEISDGGKKSFSYKMIKQKQ